MKGCQTEAMCGEAWQLVGPVHVRGRVMRGKTPASVKHALKVATYLKVKKSSHFSSKILSLIPYLSRLHILRINKYSLCSSNCVTIQIREGIALSLFGFITSALYWFLLLLFFMPFETFLIFSIYCAAYGTALEVNNVDSFTVYYFKIYLVL